MRIPVHLLLTALRRCMLESDVCGIGSHEEMSPEGQVLDDMFDRLMGMYPRDDQVVEFPIALVTLQILMPKLGTTAEEMELLVERVQQFHHAAMKGTRVGEPPCMSDLSWWLIDCEIRWRIKQVQWKGSCV